MFTPRSTNRGRHTDSKRQILADEDASSDEEQPQRTLLQRDRGALPLRQNEERSEVKDRSVAFQRPPIWFLKPRPSDGPQKPRKILDVALRNTSNGFKSSVDSTAGVQDRGVVSSSEKSTCFVKRLPRTVYQKPSRNLPRSNHLLRSLSRLDRPLNMAGHLTDTAQNLLPADLGTALALRGRYDPQSPKGGPRSRIRLDLLRVLRDDLFLLRLCRNRYRPRRKALAMQRSVMRPHLRFGRELTAWNSRGHLFNPRAIGLGHQANLLDAPSHQAGALYGDWRGDLLAAIAALLDDVDPAMGGDVADLSAVIGFQHMPECRVEGVRESGHQAASLACVARGAHTRAT